MDEATSKSRNSHRNRLALQFTVRFAVMALVPLGVALAIAWQDARKALTTELTEKLRGVASRQAMLLTETIRSRLDDAQVLATQPEARIVLTGGQASRHFADDLASFAETRNVGRIYLVTRGGEILLSTGDGPETTGNLRSPGLAFTQLGRVFARSSSVLETEVSDYLIHQPTGQPAAFIAAPVLHQGVLHGAVILQVDSAHDLGLRTDFMGLGLTGETVVVTTHHRSGELTFLAPTRMDPHAAFERRLTDRQVVPALWEAASGGRGYGVITDYRGQETFGVWRYVPALRWGILVKIDTSEALSPVRRMGRSFLMIFAVTSFLVLAAVVGASRAVVHPIRQLRDAASHRADGGMRTFLKSLPDPPNEIGDLSRSLSIMAAQLEDAMDNLEQANESLEAKVSERTRELSRKNAELEETLETLQATQERMVAQARMASLGQLTKGIAHEIKNPLNFVNNFATLSRELCNELWDVIEDSPDIPEPVTMEANDLLRMMRDNLQSIESHGRQADLIISGILEHSHSAPADDLRMLDLSNALRTSAEVAVRMMRTSSTHPEEDEESCDRTRGLIEWDLADDLGAIHAYPGELCRAFINVLSNALWAVRQEGHRPSRVPPIRIHALRTGTRESVVVIEDFGIGMAPDMCRQALIPLFTTEPTSEGTGLGLGLAHEVVTQRHQGRFDIQSEFGYGTRVTMTLPDLHSGE
jgi:two-component system NtrC family sensor kinase